MECGILHGCNKCQRWEIPAAFPYFGINSPQKFRNARLSPKCFAEVK